MHWLLNHACISLLGVHAFANAEVKGYLTGSAALLVAILIKGEHALRAHQVHALLSIWEGVLNPDAVVLFNSIKDLVSLCVEPPSVKTAADTYHDAEAINICSITCIAQHMSTDAAWYCTYVSSQSSLST